MYCNKCGVQNDDKVQFCVKCGSSVTTQDAKPTITPQTPHSTQLDTSKKAKWSLILGILGFLCCPLLSLIAIVLGFLARKEIKTSSGRIQGDGMAISGMVLGLIGMILGVIIIIVAALSDTSSGSGSSSTPSGAPSAVSQQKSEQSTSTPSSVPSATPQTNISAPPKEVQKSVQPIVTGPIVLSSDKDFLRIKALIEIINKKDAHVRYWEMVTNAPLIAEYRDLTTALRTASDEFEAKRKQKEMTELIGKLQSAFPNIKREAAATLARDYCIDISADIKTYDFKKKGFPFELYGSDIRWIKQLSCIIMGSKIDPEYDEQKTKEEENTFICCTHLLYAKVPSFLKFTEENNAARPDLVSYSLGGFFRVDEKTAEKTCKDKNSMTIRFLLKITSKQKTVTDRGYDSDDHYVAKITSIQLLDCSGKPVSTLE